MLNINDDDQKDLFRILESNNSSDSLEEDFSSSHLILVINLLMNFLVYLILK